MEWKDISSYSQQDRNHIPHTFEIRRGQIRVSISKHIAYRGNEHPWVLHCVPWYNTYHLNTAKTADEAKDAALVLIRGQINRAHLDFNEG